MLPEFDLKSPQTLAEALEILADGTPDIQPLAGGTNLIVDMRNGYTRPNVVVDVAKLDELRGIRRENGHLVVGGGVTLTELLENSLIAQLAPMMKQAAAAFANPLIRNRATVGGNLVNAAPCADTAPPLLALNAEVELTSKGGVRYVSLEEFLIDAFKTMRQPNELLTAVRWPIPPPHSAGAFQKMGLRKVTCMAKVDVAVMVEGDGDGFCQEARIALGAVAAKHFRVHAAEGLLRGQRFTAERIAEAARLAAEASQPRVGSEYKRGVVQALTRRLLTKAVDEIGQ
jgi:carbon-monoxide dehydrogenase medium subunit